MAFLHSLTLAENYRIALEGYLTVLDAVRQEIRVASKNRETATYRTNEVAIAPQPVPVQAVSPK